MREEKEKKEREKQASSSHSSRACGVNRETRSGAQCAEAASPWLPRSKPSKVGRSLLQEEPSRGRLVPPSLLLSLSIARSGPSRFMSCACPTGSLLLLFGVLPRSSFSHRPRRPFIFFHFLFFFLFCTAADWENREFIETVSAGVKKIADFLNQFGQSQHQPERGHERKKRMKTSQ
jgi:hypothetical protein